MRHLFYLILVCALISSLGGCKKKYRNMVPIEQFDIDKSNDYRYIFRKNIEDERRRDGRYRPNEFRD